VEILKRRSAWMRICPDAAFILRNLTRSQLHRKVGKKLKDRSRILEIDLLVVVAHDAVTYLTDSPAFLLHLVSIQRFRHARSAVRAMRPFKATVQALVPGVTIAIAETG
jgi:hypothetical protein